MSHKGWRSASMRKGKQAELPIVPSQWEAMLNAIGISEADAATNSFAKAWVRKWYHARFVPEDVVNAVVGRQY